MIARDATHRDLHAIHTVLNLLWLRFRVWRNWSHSHPASAATVELDPPFQRYYTPVSAGFATVLVYKLGPIRLSSAFSMLLPLSLTPFSPAATRASRVKLSSACVRRPDTAERYLPTDLLIGHVPETQSFKAHISVRASNHTAAPTPDALAHGAGTPTHSRASMVRAVHDRDGGDDTASPNLICTHDLPMGLRQGTRWRDGPARSLMHIRSARRPRGCQRGGVAVGHGHLQFRALAQKGNLSDLANPLINLPRLA